MERRKAGSTNRWMIGFLIVGCAHAPTVSNCLIVDGYTNGIARVETEDALLWVEGWIDRKGSHVKEGDLLPGSVDCTPSIRTAVHRLHQKLTSTSHTIVLPARSSKPKVPIGCPEMQPRATMKAPCMAGKRDSLEK